MQERLKLYSAVGPNGLAVYCGTISTDDGKEKKISMDFEPPKPISSSLYYCGNKFRTEALRAMLEDERRYGFIIMDGNGTLFGSLQGNSREVLHRFSVDLPNKHGRGGQSAQRFARLRMEQRQYYVLKVAEMARQIFMSEEKANVDGIILAGSADFKTELFKSSVLDPRLKAKVLKTVDISYGGENGFNQAISLASECLKDVRFMEERNLLTQYFEEISKDSGKFCFGVEDTLYALEVGTMETLICWEKLEVKRYSLKNRKTGEEKVAYSFQSSEAEWEITDCMLLLDWIMDNQGSFGARVKTVSDNSQEGAQFVKGFGGIGGILRYAVDFTAPDCDDDGLTDY